MVHNGRVPGSRLRATLPGPPAAPGAFRFSAEDVNLDGFAVDVPRMTTRRVSPVLLLVAGLVCAVGSGAAWAVSSTARDENTILNEAYTIARSEPVREIFARRIAEAFVPHTATSSPVELIRSNEIGRMAVESPAFEQAFVTALTPIYQHLVRGTTGDIVLDPVLVQQAIGSAGAIAPPNFSLRIASSDLPDLRPTLDFMVAATGALGALAALLIGVGVAISPHRGRAIMRIGRWLITTGVVTILVFWALPNLALLPLGGWIGVIGIVLATGDWLVVPASVLAAFGIAIVVMGRAGEAEERRHALSVIPSSAGRIPSRPSIST